MSETVMVDEDRFLLEESVDGGQTWAAVAQVAVVVTPPSARSTGQTLRYVRGDLRPRTTRFYRVWRVTADGVPVSAPSRVVQATTYPRGRKPWHRTTTINQG